MDARTSGIELSPTGPAVTEIDLFLYRGDPNQSGYADPRVLQAMAAARVPVLFSASLGAREWIVDGENGFIAATEDDALRIVAQLSRDRKLLRRIGLAARESVMATMHAQRCRALAFYLGVNLNE